MHQWSRRAARAGAALTAVWVVSIGMTNTNAAAVGPSLQSTPTYKADASANVLHLAALAGQAPLAGLKLGSALAAADSQSAPRTRATATQAIGAIGQQQSVSRTAGAGGGEPGSASHDGPAVQLAALTLGGSRLSANARWGESIAPAGLSSALARPGQLTLIRSGTQVLQVWRGSQGRTQTQLVAVAGQSTLGMRATASAELTAVTLFAGTPVELTIRFVTPPALVAVAAGTNRTAVQYAPPTIAVTAAQGRSYRLGVAGETVDIPLAGPGCDTCDPAAGIVRISLGGVQQHVGPTSVDAAASAVRVQVIGVPGVGPLLDTTLGDLNVSAAVPTGGLATQPVRPAGGAVPVTDPSSDIASPPAGTPTPGVPAVTPPEQTVPQPAVPATTPDSSPALPVTGTNLGVIAALGLALLGVGWIVFRAAKPKRR